MAASEMIATATVLAGWPVPAEASNGEVTAADGLVFGGSTVVVFGLA